MMNVAVVSALFAQFGNQALTLFSKGKFDFYSPLPQRFRDNAEDFRDIFEITDLYGMYDKYRDVYDGRQVIALQLRRGDFGSGKYYIPPNEWYLQWLSEIWPTLDSPSLYIASDEPEKVEHDFDEYSPLICKNVFGMDNKKDKIKAYPDAYVLSVADYVAISNSSFGFVCCMLNRHGKFWRPGFNRKLEEFDPWTSASVLLFRDYIRERDGK